MKTLKLDHELAQAVLSGKKTSTWRVNDDKDLHVNDEVTLIDKVDPTDPASWRAIGTAKISNILEKRIGEIQQADMAGHETYESTDALVKTYQGYYGPQVGVDTPMKMIRFSFTPAQGDQQALFETATKAPLIEAKLYADGGSRGNPGPSASGYVLLDMNDKIIIENGLYLGVTTNNQAEYTALKIGLEEALKRGIQVLSVYLDSMLVVNQMKGIFKIKNHDLLAIHLSVKEHAQHFKKITYTHVPRELNKLADAMVNQVLDASI